MRRYGQIPKNDKIDPELGSWSGSPSDVLEGIEETNKMALVSCLYLNYIQSYEQKCKNAQIDPEFSISQKNTK